MSFIRSILDTDLYKLTMQQAVLFGRFAGMHYQSVPVEYKFINRSNTPFPIGFDHALEEQLSHLSKLHLTDKETNFLKTLRFLKPGYIDFLRGYQFDPKEVLISLQNGRLDLKIEGPWYRTVLWEVPLLSMISETYYRMRGEHPSTDFIDKAKQKANRLNIHSVMFADFGTRRRFSRLVHEAIVQTFEECGAFSGTSNVYLAMKRNVKPIGTHAHEWFMAHAALFGYRQANRFALEAWAEEYDGDLGIALSDTFTTDVFFRDFRTDLAKLFDGIRHDSGSPIAFAEKAIAHYKDLNIDPLSKTIVFSDGLNTEKAIEIKKWCEGKIKCAFGIGTHLTNDVGATPLNIVIKMTKCNGMPTVKLSDVKGKYTGDNNAIESCKFQLELT